MMAYPETDIQSSSAASESDRLHNQCRYPRFRIPVPAKWLLGMLVFGLLTGCALQNTVTPPEMGNDIEEPMRTEFRHVAMGTLFRIVVVGQSAVDPGNAVKEAFARIDEIEAVASDWNKESEIREWCRSAPHPEPVPVSADLATLLRHSFTIHEQSEGHFDISMGSLTRLWRRCFLANRLPSESDLERAFLQTGMKFIELKGREAWLTKGGVGLDLGGIAKGYAVDQALKLMIDRGHPHTLVDGGGDLAFSVPHSDSAGWRIVLPSGPRRFDTAGAVATSGDSEKYVEIDGHRYSHILDPQTGLGLKDSSLVTVVATSATIADAWATACSVPGVWPPANKSEMKDYPLGLEKLSVSGEVESWGVFPESVLP